MKALDIEDPTGTLTSVCVSGGAVTVSLSQKLDDTGGYEIVAMSHPQAAEVAHAIFRMLRLPPAFRH